MLVRFCSVCSSLLLLGCLAAASTLVAGEPASLASVAQLRRPVALALADDGRWLFSANRRSGSISTLDTQANRVVAEIAAGQQLSDLLLTPGGQNLLALDEAAGHLLIFGRAGPALTLQHRLPVSAYPVALEISPDARRCYITSLWSRRLTIVDLPVGDAAAAQPTAKVAQTLSLPFAPRELLLLPSRGRLLVADAFGGNLGIVDADSGRLDGVRQFPAHNIRGLAATPDGRTLLVSHQILNDLAETTHNDVHWGVLMSNVLRWLALDRVLDPAADILADSHVHLAGDSNTPGADPSGIAITPAGYALVALAGDNELGMVQENDYSLFRLPVGRRPTTLVTTADGRRAYVANTLDDLITVVDLDTSRSEPAQLNRNLRLGPQPALSLADQGELLFYDASLSSDGWFSCHSCHTDGHTNGQLNDNLGDGSFGAAKQVLSLLGVADTSPWAWNGSVTSLQQQVRKSIRTTMQGRETSEQQIEALTAYLGTLRPPPSLAAARGELDEIAVARGKQLFERHACDACHAAPHYTSPESYDVGLADRLGSRRFNPPSLRGVSQRTRFFHDNRAASLEEVMEKYRHQLPAAAPPEELQDLLSFLRSL